MEKHTLCGMWDIPQNPSWDIHGRMVTLAYWDQNPGAFSFPRGPLREPDRSPQCTDSQVHSSILIQETRRHHQPRRNFPRCNPKEEISCPKPSKWWSWEYLCGASVNVSSSSQLPVGSAVTHCRCVSKTVSIFIIVSFQWISITGYHLFCIHTVGHSANTPWCASHFCDGAVFVMMNRHLGKCLFSLRGGTLRRVELYK